MIPLPQFSVHRVDSSCKRKAMVKGFFLFVCGFVWLVFCFQIAV